MNSVVQKFPVHGAGLGLRRSFLEELASQHFSNFPDFFEVAPENWMGMGGRYARQLRQFTERHAFVCHGLSLSIGGPAPLDQQFLKDLRVFLDQHQVRIYSEHLSYCSDEGQLYDLLPIPFTEAAVAHVVARVQQVQETLGRRIALENVSYYAAPGQEMSELDFLLAVLEKADCDLLLDVNNIYVNSINHGYDANAFLDALPAQRMAYVHIAGHYEEAPDLRVDTHGADVIPEVWALLDRAYARCGVLPTLLERDFNIPPLPELLTEMSQILDHQQKLRAEVRHAG
ncbi:MAG: HvfB family MNIO-type RiPP peptide maturase [Moraxellaceae bacterium]